jgi:RNA polymerase sigma-70 factor (ECF subfamily)
VTDGELVEQVRVGDTDAFGELVTRHRGAVYRAALAALTDAAEAEDVVQEAFVLAFRKIEQFRGDASVRTWKVAIAWRLALARRRNPWHRSRERIRTESTEVTAMMATGPSAEARVLDAEQVALARQHIKRLSPKLRDALLLAAAGDLTLDEIAGALKTNPSTLRWRVMEARRQLREKLDR